MRNLNEGKKKAPSYMAELSEIDKQSAIVAMEAKINHLQEMADKKKERLNMVSEDENLSELIDKKRVKMMEREIKEIEKAKLKLEKLYEKACGSKPKEMVDEDARTDAEEEGYLDGMKDEKEDMEEGYNTPSYEEGDTDPMNEDFNLNLYNKFKTMNTPINEEFLRMQKLAGIITEGEYKRRLNESAGENLELKSLQKKAYSVLKGMGFDPKITSGEAGAGKTILSKQKYKANRGFALVNLDPKTGIFDVLITSTSLKRNKDNTATNLNPDQEANKVVDGLEKLIDKNKFEVGYKQTTDKGGSTYQIFVRAKSTGKKGGVMATESFLNEAVKLSDIMQGDKFKGGVSLVQNISYKNKEYLDAAKMTPSSIKKEEGNRDQLVLVKKGKAIEYGIDDGEVADLITYEEALKKL